MVTRSPRIAAPLQRFGVKQGRSPGPPCLFSINRDNIVATANAVHSSKE